MLDKERVKEKISAFLRVPKERVVDAALLTDLVTDSFVLIDLVIELQEEFSARLNQEDLKDVRTVDDLIGQLDRHIVK